MKTCATHVDADGLLSAWAQLDHFEVIVEINGIEGTSSNQVQARWSYVLDEMQGVGDSKTTTGNSFSWGSCGDLQFQTPSVEIIQGMAHVQRSAVVSWQNKNGAAPEQLARALDFVIPQ